MSKWILSGLLSFLWLNLAAQGQLLEKQHINSDLLGESADYSIYLPEDYERSSRSYPVLYLLHGYSDDDSGWVQYGEAHLTADELMGRGDVPPMIIVMPDAGVSWYVNDDAGERPYEDFFFQEFIPHVEQNYRVRTDRQFRAIAGLSMGGHGALLYAVRHPELFSAVCPLSPAVFTHEQVLETEQQRWDDVFGPPFKLGAAGEDRLSDHFINNSPPDLIQFVDAEALSQVGIYLDCGDDDWLLPGNFRLAQVLASRDIPFELRIRDGGHTWSYWRSALPQVLKFVGARFRR